MIGMMQLSRPVDIQRKGKLKMKRLTILAVALLAVFALAAIFSATSFSAIELLNNRKEQIKTGLKVSSHLTTARLEILEDTEIKCPEVSIEAELTSARLGSFHFHGVKCTTTFGSACTGLGDEAEVILALGTFHMVEDKLTTEGTLGAAVLFLVETAHFSCKTVFGTTLLNVSGELLCLVSPLTVSKSTLVKCEQGAQTGDPGETVYWNEAGTKVTIGENGLSVSENGGAARMAAVSREGEGTLSEEVELMD